MEVVLSGLVTHFDRVRAGLTASTFWPDFVLTSIV